MNKRRVVITGCGVISCVGNDVRTFWDAVVNGRCGLGQVTRFDVSEYRTQIAGEVKDFNVCDYLSFKESKRMDLFCHYAIAAADEAMKQAGLPVNGDGLLLVVHANAADTQKRLVGQFFLCGAA